MFWTFINFFSFSVLRVDNLFVVIGDCPDSLSSVFYTCISRHAKLYCASLFLRKVSRGTPLPFLFIDNKTRDIPDFHIAFFPLSPGGH